VPGGGQLRSGRVLHRPPWPLARVRGVQRYGSWGQARALVGPHTNGSAIQSLACPATGSCAAGGYYTNRGGRSQAFVVSERDGRWGPARPQIPGSAARGKDAFGEIGAISCGAPGYCSAAGPYQPIAYGQTAMVVTEQHGRWGRAKQMPGLARLPGNLGLSSIWLSCASAGNCTATGADYEGGCCFYFAFVAGEQHGTWQPATPKPSLSQIGPVACISPGNCTAAGFITHGPPYPSYAVIISERHGTWGQARRLRFSTPASTPRPVRATTGSSTTAWLTRAPSR
jgi:hypothetical protein